MYDIKDLGSLIPGGSVEPHAINYAGHVVGAATAQGGPRHAFYWTNQSGIKDLGCLQGDDHSAAGDINDSNVIVGYSRDNNSERSCVWVGALCASRTHPGQRFVRPAHCGSLRSFRSRPLCSFTREDQTRTHPEAGKC